MVSALRLASVAELVRERAWALAVWAGMLTWALVVFAIVHDHYVKYRLARFDLGNMVQAVWSTAQGRPLEISDATGEQMVRLGAHADPILAVLASLWILAPSPLTLIAVQIVGVALGALPVFWLARRHLKSDMAATLLALAYLAYPWIAWTAVDAFHPVTLAISLLLFAVWFLDDERLLPFALCAVLAAMTGELIGLSIAALGIWYAFARARRTTGLAIAAVGIGWTIVALFVVVPAFSGGSSRFYGLYDDVGGSPSGIVQTAFTDPGVILAAVGRTSDLLYVLLLAAPLAGAFVLAPGLAAVALPQLALNALADISSATDPRAHYVAGILPFFFAAIAIGLGRFSQSGRVRGAVLVLTLSAASSLVVGPWPGALGGAPTFFRTDASPERIGALDRAVALVPDEAPVSSTNRVGSHLAARRYAYSVPVVARAEWIVLDSSDPWLPKKAGGNSDPEGLRRFRERIERSPEWRKVFDEYGVLVFRRAQA